MTTVRSILVDIDAVAADHPALEQAVSLATRCSSSLKIVDVLPWVPSSARHFVTQDLEGELIDHRSGRLRRIAEGVRGVAATTELLRGRPGTALVQEVLRSGHDLLVRAHTRDSSAGPRLYGAIDMELLRHCPCPVWLVARHQPHQPWRIAAAIHASADDPVEQQLNGTIIEWALALDAFGNAQLAIIQAWTPYGANILRSHMGPDEFAEFVETTRQSEEHALNLFLAPFAERLASARVELLSGEPEDAIARFVETHGVDVVVMGTVARTGIAGLIMGNTAERVLRRLQGSVFAVKPPGYQTPVEKD